MFWRLAESLRRDPPEGEPRTLSVAELYQERLPYRLARGELGLAELAEYEHVLLRLLAGERSYAQLDDPAITEELARELRSPNPILGVYRDYPDAAVRLRSPGPAAVVTAPEPLPARPGGDASVPAPERCPVCSAGLPAGRTVTFCPECGRALRPVACRTCGGELEPAWTFCVECGAERGPSLRSGR